MNKFKQLEDLFKAVVIDMRADLASGDIPRMEFSLEAEGRTHDGEMLIKIELGQYGSEVRGRSIAEVLAEFKRRHGWNKRNAPLELAAPEEVPF